MLEKLRVPNGKGWVANRLEKIGPSVDARLKAPGQVEPVACTHSPAGSLSMNLAKAPVFTKSRNCWVVDVAVTGDPVRRRWNSTLPKAKNLSCAIGPPSEPPNWLRTRLSF